MATVDKDSKVVLKPIKIARDFGTEVEVNAGITEGERIILNPSDSLISGTLVEVVSSDKASSGKKPS